MPWRAGVRRSIVAARRALAADRRRATPRAIGTSAKSACAARNCSTCASSSSLQQRAGDIDEPPARPHQALRAVEDVGLERGQFGEVLGREAPFRVGIAPPGAGAGAGRVDQHAVEAPRVALHPFVARARRAAGAGRCWRRRGAAARSRARAGAPTISQATRWPRFSIAAASARVLPPAPAQKSTTRMPGPRIDQQRRELRALVLHLDQAVAERVERRQRDAREDPQARAATAACARPRPRRRASARARRLAVGSSARLTRRSSGAPRPQRRHLAREIAAQRGARDAARARPDNCRATSRGMSRCTSVRPASAASEPRARRRRAARGGSGRRRRRARCRSGVQPSISTSAASTRVRASGASPPSLARDPPIERGAMAQHGIDMLGDRAAGPSTPAKRWRRK